MSFSSHEPALQQKLFAADTPWGARAAASAWLSDFAEHGPCDIRSIRVLEDEDFFVAVLTYSEMALDEADCAAASKPMLRSA